MTPDNPAAEVPPEVRAAVERVTAFLDERERPTAFAPVGFLPVNFLSEITRTGDRLLASDLRTVLAALDDAERERDQLRRGGKELGKSLVFWLDLAVKATGSEDCVEDDGDGDYGVVAERLAALGSRAEAAEQRLAAVRALADEWQRLGLPGMTEYDYGTDLRAALGDADREEA